MNRKELVDQVAHAAELYPQCLQFGACVVLCGAQICNGGALLEHRLLRYKTLLLQGFERCNPFTVQGEPKRRALIAGGRFRERAVRELLANPQYGQNWARYWRDVILSRRLEDRAAIVANPLVADLVLVDEASMVNLALMSRLLAAVPESARVILLGDRDQLASVEAGAVLADINVGLLYLLAVSSLGVYGIIIAGWASNSKYPFYSALRAAAQMVSYEVSIGFVLIPVVLWAGTFNLSGIVEGQQGHIFGLLNGFGFNPLLFPLAVIFLISAMAETARAPFDLTEAESELVAGYQTEYSSMSFALFWLGEYGNVLLMCAMNALLFWGGWLPPVDWAPLYAVPGILWFFLKIFIFFFIFSWVKATVPRFRYDQLMRLGWKIFLPISLIWVFLVSGYLMLQRDGMLPW